MQVPRLEKEDAHARRTRELLDDAFATAAKRGLRARLWDGTMWPLDAPPGVATLVLEHPGTLRQMLVPGTELGLAEAYVHGDFDLEGDWEAALEAVEPVRQELGARGARARLAAKVLRLPRGPRLTDGRGPARLRGIRHSVERDKQAVRYHYDVSNAFFSIVLGPTMVYSCAYFERPDATLEDAQTAKLDLVCRKLRLRKGQTLLDIGCGWGSLAMHAAKAYGARVTGITLSEPQARLANQRVREAGLEDQVTIRVQDYREVDGEFDAISSIGMFEHVGATRLAEYFARARDLLKPRGVMLNHGIACVGTARSPPPRSFIRKYVFPDGDLVPIETTLASAAGAGFEVRDVESLREHYALTLRAWVRNLECGRAEARAHVSEETYRVWRLYMASCARSFRLGTISVYQTLLAKPADGDAGLPMTRADWYA